MNQGQSLGFEMGSTLDRAVLKFNARVRIAGRVTQGGAGVGGVYPDSGQARSWGDAFCQPSAPDGYFGCTVPPNWKGTLTPSKTGLSFNPPQRRFSDLTRNDDNASFEAR